METATTIDTEVIFNTTLSIIVEESSRTGENPDFIVLKIGVCNIVADIWYTLLNLVNASAAYIHAGLMDCGDHLIFDGYTVHH